MAHTDLPPDIHARIYAGRLTANLTQREAAERAGVTEQTWRAWELGTVPRVDRFPAIARVLEMDPAELAGWDTP